MLWRVAAGSALVVGLLWGGWRYLERQAQAGLLPPELAAGAPIYANTVARGIGPGANEAGFLVYDLPAPVVDQLETGALHWLTQTDPRFGPWRETPVVPGDDWDSVLCTGAECFSLAMFAQRYTFLDKPLDPNHLRPADAAIARPGSYYAYGRHGILVIDPAAARAYLAYRG